MNRHVPNEKDTIGNCIPNRKYINGQITHRRLSRSLAVREMQIKVIRYHFTS